MKQNAKPSEAKDSSEKEAKGCPWSDTKDAERNQRIASRSESAAERKKSEGKSGEDATAHSKHYSKMRSASTELAAQPLSGARAATNQQVKVIAHRGGRKWAPENTLAAFRKSLEFGVDGIELDIQRCLTGELVVIHDSDINRTTNGVGLVRDISLAELKRISAGLWFGQEFKDERIPLLSEVLELINGKLILNIEIKNTPVEYEGIEDDLLELLANYPYWDKIMVCSFDHGLIHRLHKKEPKLSLVVLADALLFDIVGYAKHLGASYWTPNFQSMNVESVAIAQAGGIQVYPWTVNEPRHWDMVISMGVDGIETDDPQGLVNYLKEKSV